ncbi:MAG: TIGR02099 family protein [Rhodocyclaceae bacterium]|nr:TIGR02099 family protein [Rhodocyclaceae bacterium]
MTVQSAMPHVDREPEIRARGMASRVARWALVAYFVVGIAFLLLRHVVLPGADAFRGPIAEALTRSLGVEFGIGRVVADWQGLSPVLRLADVTIHDLSQRSALRLSAVEAALSWRSLLRGRPEFAYLSIVEPELDVRRESDGRLMIAGFEVSAGGGNGGLGSWLLEQPEIRIVDATLVWTDGQRKVPPLVLEHMNLRLQNADGRHRFGLVASPPKAYASMVDLRGEFAAIDGRDWQDLRGKFFVRLERADLGAWQNWVTYPVPLDGSGGASAWIELEGAGRYAGRVDLSLRDARTRLRADLPELAVQRLEGTLLARREGRRVLVETRGLRLDGERLDVPDLDAHVEFLPHTDDETGHGSVRARHLDIGALAALAAHLPFEPRLLAQLAGHSPAGQVFDLEYDWQGAEVAPGLWRLKGRAEGVTIAAGNGWPGVEGVSGHFSGDQDGGEFAVEGRQVGIALPEIFPEPRIQLDQLSLDGRWGRRDGRLEIGVEQARFDNRDAAGQLSGRWHATPTGAGRIELGATLSRANGTAVWRYLPRVVPAATRNWLRSAIRAGHAPAARLELQGDLADFPFPDNQGGRFLVSARLERASLQFHPDWPAIDDIAGELRFEGSGMHIRAERARIGDALVERASVRIPDLGNGDQQLLVEGQARGPTMAFLDYLEASPVAGWIGHATDDFEASGSGALSLSLALPLHRLDRSRVSGEYRLTGNEVRLFPSLPALVDASGRVGFDNRGVSIHDATATLLGQRVGARGQTDEDGYLRISAAGTASAAAIREWVDLPLLAGVDGIAGWNARIDVGGGVGRVTVRSDLNGVRSALPQPLTKVPEQRWPSRLALEIHERGARQHWQIALGTGVESRFVRRRSGDGRWRLEKGGIAVNVPVREAEGGLMAAIRMDSLDLDAWRALFTPGGDDGPLLAGIALQAGRLQLFGESFAGVELRGIADAGGWRGRLTSDAVAGEFDWRSRDRGALVARFERLLIGERPVQPAAAAGSAAPLEGLPELDVVAQRFELRGMALGSMSLKARNQGGEWMLDRLELRNPHGVASAEGRWQPGGATELGFNAEVSDVGAYLDQIGYPEAVRNGRAVLDGKLTWTGPPTNLDYDSLGGRLQVAVDDGQFRKLEPGVGRLLGVLSLQALPRRVTLDFRDVFSEGFAFDRIEGGADVENGIMHTDGLDIRGPAARIRLSGSVDLARESQRLRVEVQPTLTESVAVGAALANSATGLINPVAGLVTYLAQKIMQDPIEKLFSYEYAVTGAWKDPQVDKLASREPERDSAQPLSR